MSQRTLVLMRHAKSDWSGDEPDLMRPIGRRGRRQADEAGRWLGERLPDLELVLVSPAVRARTTWQVAADASGLEPTLVVDERAYTFGMADLITVLGDVDETVTSALLVGHNPALDELVDWLTGESVAMVTSAVAVIRLAHPWASLRPRSGLLVAVGRPPG